MTTIVKPDDLTAIIETFQDQGDWKQWPIMYLNFSSDLHITRWHHHQRE